MYQKKNLLDKRISKRRYPIRKCKKPDCQEDFVPSDSRKIYCCEQHRVDFNNDKRKQKEAITNLFLKKIKSNEAILEKIKISDFYNERKGVFKLLLDYEYYDFKYYHQIIINKKTGYEAHVCFGYILELVDPEKQFFIIKKTSENEL
jgi:hypothetical protein